ncbi:hypothetical protein [Ensifer canadensis]|uniref:hypothetical protein n=1 Tax=Ensifer canadensis TaxID=555315 RepID=UPI0035E3DFAE
MKKDANERREQKRSDQQADAPLFGEGSDVCFFNPWDQRFKEDLGLKRDSFDFN